MLFEVEIPCCVLSYLSYLLWNYLLWIQRLWRTYWDTLPYPEAWGPSWDGYLSTYPADPPYTMMRRWTRVIFWNWWRCSNICDREAVISFTFYIIICLANLLASKILSTKYFFIIFYSKNLRTWQLQVLWIKENEKVWKST